ncbi:MAG TPA: hypothetical protein VE251_10590, partial [Xanthobacteraceae bacterium]|nr:hypothetical protein [Xanthobacteraceae bacterium]
MRIAVAREIDASESRVAATPETVKKMKALGADIAVEPDAGTKSGIPDAEFAAAGTVPAAKVFVMGAGVAGLQAIATARRLGAIVTATDVRPAAKEQVASLGAKF